MRSRTRRWGGGVRSVGPKKISDPQFFWPFAATDTTASWNNNWKLLEAKKNAEVQVLCDFSPNLAHSIQTSQIMDISWWNCCKFDSVKSFSLRIKTAYWCAEDSEEPKTSCPWSRDVSKRKVHVQYYYIWQEMGGSSLEVKKDLPTPGSKFFPGTPLNWNSSDLHTNRPTQLLVRRSHSSIAWAWDQVHTSQSPISGQFPEFRHK
jgi:hypothetical protein